MVVFAVGILAGIFFMSNAHNVFCQEIKEKDLVGYWKFDEGKGDTAKDSSQAGNDGDVTSEWVKGSFGNALYFAGMENVTVSDNEILHFGNSNFTLEFWIKPESLDKRLISKPNYPNGWWCVDILKDGRVEMEMGDENKQNGTTVSSSSIDTKQWWHLAIAVDRQNFKTHYYFNGKFDGTKDIPSSFTGNLNITGKSLFIGSNWNGFIGLIDEVKIYKRMLTEFEVKMDYEKEKDKRTDASYEYTEKRVTLKKETRTIAELPVHLRLRGIESRPVSNEPVTFAENLERLGCNVCTIGTMNGQGLANFPTTLMKPNPNMKPEWIPGIVKEAHSRNIALISWVVFNVQDIKDVDQFQPAKDFPEWTMKFIEDPQKKFPPRVGMCVLSSPYIQHHAKFLREVAGTGVDGIFFDGFYLGGIPHPPAPGCVCEFCEKKFKKEAGLDIPKKVDWNDPTFKRWVRWRNEKIVETANYFKKEMQSVKPDLMVTFNYNIWPFGGKDWETAIPMWKTSDYGVSQHAYTGTPGQEWIMLGFKARISHDLNPEHSDIWRYAAPTFKFNNTKEDIKCLELEEKLFMLAGLTYGTTSWRAPWQSSLITKKVNESMMLRENYFSQNQVRHIGILVSQNTHDFYGHQETDNLNSYRDGVLGTWLLLTEQHIPFEFVFDNQVEDGKLDGFKMIILSNAAAISKKQVEKLSEWINAGGYLIATSETGMYDEWGNVLKRSSMQDMFDSPYKNIGKGRVYYIKEDPGLTYARERNKKLADEIIGIIKQIPLPVEFDAPKSLAVNTFWNKDKKELWVHLLNVSSYYLLNEDCGFRGLERPGAKISDVASDAQLSGEGLKQTRVHIQTKNVKVIPRDWKIKSARTVIGGEELKPDSKGIFTVPVVDEHEVLVLQKE